MQSQFSNTSSSYVSFDSLIQAQQSGSKTQGAEAIGASDDFKHMVETEGAKEDRFARSRTGGSMPQYGQNYAAHLRQSYAPSASEPSSEISDYIGRNNTAHRTFSEGELARKYVRESDPRYADVSIGDFVDIINPLQHIPVVSSVYRHVTGDEIKPPARILGGGIYGGPIGMASAMANAVVEDQTGKDIGDNLVASITETRQKSAIRSSFAGTEPASGEARPVSFEAAKKAYSGHSGVSQSRALDIEWDNSKVAGHYAPIDISDQIVAEQKFFDNERSALSYNDVLNGQSGVSNAPLDGVAPSARAFGPGAYGASTIHQATKAYGGARTSGDMPEYSAKTMSLKPKEELAAQLRMDNPPAREPVTRVQFGQ